MKKKLASYPQYTNYEPYKYPVSRNQNKGLEQFE